MAADPRYYSRGVVASLAMVSGGTCYWPEPRCLVPVTADVDGDLVLNVEIAHIRAAEENGPRYVPEMTNEERRMFGNLLLLCPKHHRVIDKLHPAAYSIERLDGWKRDREAGSFDVLRSLPELDEDALQASITHALREQAGELRRQADRFEAAIERLAAIDREAAGYLSDRMDAAEALQDAARKLQHTEYTAVLLESAAQRLANTQDTAEILLAVSRNSAELWDFMGKADELRKGLHEVDEQLAKRIHDLNQDR